MARSLDQLLRNALENHASDLHLKVGRPPLLRVYGELKPVETEEPFTDEELQGLLDAVMTEPQRKVFLENLEVDFAYEYGDEARFRVNLFHRMGHVGAVLRHIPIEIPTVDQLGLPEVLKELVKKKQGMILVTGPTGSGKSTSLAAMINELNGSSYRHIVTIEDPIEFVYTDDKCVINQRELGVDTLTPMRALKMALRQDPDVILMGEMRDVETVEMGMAAAETGHILMSTLHTNDAKQTVERLLDMFPPDKIKQLRNLLSMTLLAVVSQRLLPKADGSGRVAALELMVMSPHIQELIAEGHVQDIDEAIKNSDSFYKMQSFNQSLARLVKEGLVTEDDAMATSSNPGDLRLMIRGISMGSRGLSAG